MKTAFTAWACAVVLLLAGCGPDSRPGGPTTRSTTRPTTSAADLQGVELGRLPTLTVDAPAGGGPASYGDESYRLVNQRDEVVSVLKNGMTVVAKRVPSPVVSVRGYVYTGGVYEGKWLGGGLSHLLEHLVAGGSNKRRTEAANRDLLQKLGNNSNAYTTYDHTAYFVNTTNDMMEPAVDLVTGWMLGALITPDEYAREYKVVQRELEMGKGEPDRVFYYLGQSNRYKVSPAKVPVIGYQEVIQGLSRDDVYSYYQLAYVPNNMVFTVTGNLDPEAMLAAVRKHVAAARPDREFSRDIAPEPPVLSPRTLVGTYPKLGEARLQIGFPTVRLDSPDLYALDLLATVLGGGESSLLVEELRDDKQLVSGIEVVSDTPHYVDGTFQVQMALDPTKIAEATDAALAEVERVKTAGVDEGRLARAKTQVKASRVRQLQTSEEIGETLANDFMSTGDPHFTDKYVARIGEVTNEQIKAVAGRYFDRSRLLTTALLPAEYVGAAGLPKAEDVLRAVAPTTKPGHEQPASPVARVELEDGTILLVKRISTSPLVVMQLYSEGGVTAEDEKTNGLGNLAMETAARGTKTRSAVQIAEFFDSIGGELDLKCGTNSWNWNATCLKENFDKAFEVYADVINNPTFADAEVAGMKKRVIAAIGQQDADWTQQAFRFFKKSYFGPMKSPYQFLPVGTEENVKGFTGEQVRGWYGDRVLTGRKVLAIFGDVDPAAAEKLARQYLGRGPKAKAPGKATFVLGDQPPPPAGDKPGVTVAGVELNKTEQALAGVVVGYRANSVIGDPANFPLAVADTMTSGYTYGSGYLYEILRGRGLVYVVHAVNVPGRSKELPGTFMIYAGCDPSKVDEVVDVILENIARVQGTPKDVNEDWFKRSKELIVVAEAMETETPAAQAQQAALDELFGLGYTWHEGFADKVRAVQLPDVRSVARDRLRECVVTVSTPVPEQVKVKAGRREYDSFPPVDLTPRGVQHDAGGK